MRSYSLPAARMTRISSRLTFLNKRVFPVIWFGSLGLFLLVAVVGSGSQRPVLVPFLIMPILMAGFGFFIMKKLLFDLADEVWDAGSELLIKNKGLEIRIALGSIVNVNYSHLTNPQRVTLTLRQPTALGSEITFAAPTVWIPFAKSPIIEDLIQRVDRARGFQR